MRTREIVVYFDHDTDFDNINNQDLCEYIHGGVHGIRAKIIVELPDQKVELTESDFHIIWQKVNGCTYKNGKEAELYKGLKKELFGE